jgi:uncharacterized protein (TIGR03067 family)
MDKRSTHSPGHKPGITHSIFRAYFLFSILLVIAGCSSSKNAANKTGLLNGTWVPEIQEIGGNPLPAAAFANQKLIITDTNYTVMAESIDKGVVKYKEDKIDIYGKDGVNAGKHFTALFKLENGLLTICYNLKGDNYPESFDTKGKPLFFLSVFKKAE